MGRIMRMWLGVWFLSTFLTGGVAMAGDAKVVLETNQGKIVVSLFSTPAPKTVENFLGLVKRVIITG